MRSGEARGIRPHRRQSRRIVEQQIDLPGEDREVVAPDRRAGLEEVIGVSFLLAGDGRTITSASPRARASELVRPPGLPTRRPDAAMYSSISVV
jgi:hypothetical protein